MPHSPAQTVPGQDGRSFRKEMLRSSHGDPAAIASYLESSSNFERALDEFAVRYARQNELDYEAFMTEIRDGRLAAEELQ